MAKGVKQTGSSPPFRGPSSLPWLLHEASWRHGPDFSMVSSMMPPCATPKHIGTLSVLGGLQGMLHDLLVTTSNA